MRELHARENGHHVGVFSEDDEERISFEYDANVGLPISLSLICSCCVCGRMRL